VEYHRSLAQVESPLSRIPMVIGGSRNLSDESPNYSGLRERDPHNPLLSAASRMPFRYSVLDD